MKRTLAFLVILATLFTLNANDAYTVIANPGEDASRQIRINWHSDNDNGKSHCFYTISTDTAWTKAKKAKAKRELCTAYDSMYSKTPAGENIYENAKFIRNTVELKKLKPGTKYMYRIGNTASEGDIHYFKTAPAEVNGQLQSFPISTPTLLSRHEWSRLWQCSALCSNRTKKNLT